MFTEKQVTSLTDYIDFVNTYFERGRVSSGSLYVLFRGQNQDWELLPKIARTTTNNGHLQFDEKTMFDCFKREAIRFLHICPNNDWDWLAVARHYGLPTRLLDWSKNPLVALWFAVECFDKRLDSPGVVWIYQPDYSDVITSRTIAEDPFGSHHTKVYAPQHIVPRIYSQDGVFTAHRYLTDSKRFVALQRDEREKDKLTKILVPSEYFQIICAQLERLGVHSASLFADLDGLSRHITKQFTLKT